MWWVIFVVMWGGLVFVMIVVCELDICIIDMILVKFYKGVGIEVG